MCHHNLDISIIYILNITSLNINHQQIFIFNNQSRLLKLTWEFIRRRTIACKYKWVILQRWYLTIKYLSLDIKSFEYWLVLKCRLIWLGQYHSEKFRYFNFCWWLVGDSHWLKFTRKLKQWGKIKSCWAATVRWHKFPFSHSSQAHRIASKTRVLHKARLHTQVQRTVSLMFIFGFLSKWKNGKPSMPGSKPAKLR